MQTFQDCSDFCDVDFGTSPLGLLGLALALFLLLSATLPPRGMYLEYFQDYILVEWGEERDC